MADRHEDRAALVEAARGVEAETGVSAGVLLAVAIVETAAVATAVFDNRREPLIRFEGHYFDRLLSPKDRIAARAAGLSNPKAGAVANPRSQAARWRLLDRASAIDASAALASTSWGLGQVMGAHWKALGYRDPQALAAEARGSVEGQFRLMAKFLRIGDLNRRLERGDRAGFARLYNGPAYRQNGYDAKIGRAYDEAAQWLAATAPAPPRSSGAGTPAASPPSAATSPEARAKSEPKPAAEAASKAGKGWSNGGGSLSAIASWLMHRFSTRAATRFFSTSTERSSASATIPPPSASTLRS